MKIPLCLAALSCCAVAARADQSFVQTITIPQGSPLFVMDGMVIKTSMQGKMSVIDVKTAPDHVITLRRGDGLTTQYSPETKTYTQWKVMPKIPKAMPAGIQLKTLTVAVKNLGFQTLKAQKVSHWMVNLAMDMGGSAGRAHTTVGIEVWSTDIPFEDPSAASGGEKLPGFVAGMLGDDVKIKGDLIPMRAVFAKMPLRQRVVLNGQVLEEVSSSGISKEPIAPDLFKMPEGFKKMSFQEFLKASQQRTQDYLKGKAEPVAPKSSASNPQSL